MEAIGLKGFEEQLISSQSSGHHNTMPLDSAEREQLVRQAFECGAQLLRTVKMVQLGGRLGTKVFHGSSTTRISYVRRATIFGSLDQVANLYIHQCSPQLIDTADTQVVHVVQAPTPEHPLQAINLRWVLVGSPNPKLVSHRDFFYLESLLPFVDETGTKGWLRCAQSIESPDCPDYNQSHGYIRGEMHCCGVVFRETNVPNELDSLFYYDVDAKGRLPGIFAELMSKARSRQCAPRVNSQLRTERTFSQDKQNRANTYFSLYPEEKKRKCRACLRRLTMLNFRKKCSNCQSILCRNCANAMYDRPLASDGVSSSSTSFCFFCNGSKPFKTRLQSSLEDSMVQRMTTKSIDSTSNRSFNQQVQSYEVCSSMEIEDFMDTSIHDRQRTLSSTSEVSVVSTSRDESTNDIPIPSSSSVDLPAPTVVVGKHPDASEPPVGPIFMNEDSNAPLCDLSYLARFK